MADIGLFGAPGWRAVGFPGQFLSQPHLCGRHELQSRVAVGSHRWSAAMLVSHWVICEQPTDILQSEATAHPSL